MPLQWREGLLVNLFKKGDKEDPGNYRGIMCCRESVLVEHLEKSRAGIRAV